jgi:transposase
MPMGPGAVEKPRRGKHRQLMTEGDFSLCKTKYFWSTGFENLPEQQKNLSDAVYSRHLRTGKSMGVQRNAPRSLGPEYRGVSDRFFNDWHRRLIHTRLGPMRGFSKSIKERLRNVVNLLHSQHHMAVGTPLSRPAVPPV